MNNVHFIRIDSAFGIEAPVQLLIHHDIRSTESLLTCIHYYKYYRGTY